MRRKLGLAPVLGLLAAAGTGVFAADCKVAVVGQPNSNCFDIWTAAKITQAQFMQYNPGINCSALQPGQKVCISAGTLPNNAPKPNPDGSCYTYKTVADDTCAAIAVKFDITTALIEQYNQKTYKWTGCAGLQRDYTMCVSSGSPPPIPVNPNLQCGPESKGNVSCPLHACCSQFGFCGLTDEFCHTTEPNPCIRDCGQPTVPSCGGGQLTKKLAYYAGWGNRRTPCSWANVSPGDIDWSGYTHVHFAFATISQGMQIQLTAEDEALLGELVDVKATRYPSMQVVIAVGGWAFSVDDPTRDLFSVMVSTSNNRRTFIDSVELFLNRFKLNGIDIDFEYPAAIERQGPPEDTPNLTAFFEELRARLSPSKFALSIAAPAGYWFLKGFEIDKIAPNLDYINMMSYDYHGPWDVNITDQDPVTNPQSSIKDMRDSASLYVRAKIPLEKTNLGLAFYGRTFKLADPNCKGYGCKLTGSGGGAPGECTVTSGYLAQFEIERQLQQTGIKPTYDDATKTYWYNYNGDLITFDRQDTWDAKKQFAGSTCFSGTFVWSADQVLSGNGGGGPGGPGEPGSPGGTPSMTTIVWNPNPYPSSGAASETFSQSAGVYTVTTRTRVGATTSTATETVTQPAWTETTLVPTVISGTSTRTTSKITHPATIQTSTHVVTVGGTVVTTTQVVTRTSTVIVIPIPTTTTSIVFPGPPGGEDDDDDVTITLAPGGTPIRGPLPPFITPRSFITPTWTYHILPPPSAKTVTFTAPLTGSITYSSTAPVPEKSSDPPRRIDNPKDDKNSCNGGSFFNLLFGGLINPCMPLDVGIRIGITPWPIPPPGWTGPWVNPFPIPTPPPPGAPPPEDPEDPDEDPDDPEETECALPPTVYTAGPDPENAGDEADTFVRRRFINESLTLAGRDMLFPQLVPRAGGRHIQAAGCPNAVATSPNLVSLGAGTFYSVGRISDGTANTGLGSTGVPGRPLTGGASPQEHVFELGYIDQWLASGAMANLGCAWYETNIFHNRRIEGANGNIGDAILARIDNTNNMVWADRAMNQAKSNVVNNNRNDPNHPPQEQLINSISDFVNSADAIYNVEFFARNFAALGSYFNQNAARFRSVAGDVMTILSEITPTSPPHDSKSIPLLFYEWLENTISAYPQGSVNRANAVLRAYQAKMNQVSLLTGVIPVPQCFPVYHQGVTPSNFNHMNLMPRRPPMSECNPPGTLGRLGVFDSNGRAVIDNKMQIARTMGSGSTFTVGLGSGSNLDDWHFNAWVGNNPGSNPRCNNVYQVREHDPTSRPPAARSIFLTFGCQSQQGGYPFWVGLDKDGGGYLECAIAEWKGSGDYNYFCGPTKQDAFNCMEDTYGLDSTTANQYDGVWHFFPE